MADKKKSPRCFRKVYLCCKRKDAVQEKDPDPEPPAKVETKAPESVEKSPKEDSGETPTKAEKTPAQEPVKEAAAKAPERNQEVATDAPSTPPKEKSGGLSSEMLLLQSFSP